MKGLLIQCPCLKFCGQLVRDVFLGAKVIGRKSLDTLLDDEKT
jgi:hypothetical protein